MGIFMGAAFLVATCAVYVGITGTRGHGRPMGVVLGTPPPLVVVSPQEAPEIEVCVTPAGLGRRARVQWDGKDVLTTRRKSSEFTQPECSGTTIGISPQTLAPGIHRLTFTSFYSGRYRRRVGIPVAAGPFEDRDSWIPCAARIWIGQDFLDAAGESQHDLAHAIEHMLLRRRFTESCLTGAVVESDVQIGWIESGIEMSAMMRLDSRDVIELKTDLHLSTDDGKLEINIPRSSLSARLEGPALQCEREKYAHEHPILAFLFARRVKDEIHRQARKQLREAAVQMIERELLGPVLDVLEAPKPMQLAESQEAQLLVRYGDLAIEPEQGALLCLDLNVTTAPHEERTVPGPPKMAQTPLPPERERSQSLRIDLSLQAMNAALDAVWRTGLLDRLLMNTSATWDGIFEDLTVRPTAMAFELPPVIQPGKAGPELTVGDLRVWLEDREQPERPARIADLWARVDLGALYVEEKNSVQLSAQVRDFGLSCQQGDAGELRLEPCFSDAVQMFQGRLLDQPIATGAVGMVMIPLEKWLPGESDGNDALAVELAQAELRPMAGGNWYQLFADLLVRDAQER